jgi:hypothetical protein
MTLKNSTYDKLKPVAFILLPLLTFAAALVNIWNIPHGAEIAATIAAVDTLIGAILKLSSDNYHAGTEDFENPVEKLIASEAMKSIMSRGDDDET